MEQLQDKPEPELPNSLQRQTSAAGKTKNPRYTDSRDKTSLMSNYAILNCIYITANTLHWQTSVVGKTKDSRYTINSITEHL